MGIDNDEWKEEGARGLHVLFSLGLVFFSSFVSILFVFVFVSFRVVGRCCDGFLLNAQCLSIVQNILTAIQRMCPSRLCDKRNTRKAFRQYKKSARDLTFLQRQNPLPPPPDTLAVHIHCLRHKRSYFQNTRFYFKHGCFIFLPLRVKLPLVIPL